VRNCALCANRSEQTYASDKARPGLLFLLVSGFALERRAALAAPAGFRRRLPSGLPCTARTYIHTSIRDKEPVFAALTGRPVIRVPAKPNCLTVDGGAKLRLHPTAFGLVLWVRHVFPYGPVPVQEITCPVRGSNNSDTSHTSPPPPPQASVSRMLALDRALLLSP